MAEDLRIQTGSSIPIEPERPNGAAAGEASLSTLLRQLADDGRTLVQQEIILAKAELGANARSFVKRAAMVLIGLVLIGLGFLVLLAFVVLALGRLLGDEYWLSSLIVGLALAAAGGITAIVGKRGLEETDLKPQQAVATLRESTDWARAEAGQMRRELTSPSERR